ncbi:hypothetical protein BDY19DRAFT_975393 [Irpex rosettiformis]|uniref:Uncharacterized protein n=1 Tax=Irpex rosettiformis TaxID=378272 RepID=A0ACB8TP98_9APHY|nr:hypothetical protein BDY19DRAFT_975393 [Irpex rosettiformis]
MFILCVVSVYAILPFKLLSTTSTVPIHVVFVVEIAEVGRRGMCSCCGILAAANSVCDEGGDDDEANEAHDSEDACYGAVVVEESAKLAVSEG